MHTSAFASHLPFDTTVRFMEYTNNEMYRHKMEQQYAQILEHLETDEFQALSGNARAFRLSMMYPDFAKRYGFLLNLAAKRPHPPSLESIVALNALAEARNANRVSEDDARKQCMQVAQKEVEKNQSISGEGARGDGERDGARG